MVYSVFLWRKGFRQDDRVNYLLLLFGFALHTSAMAKRGFDLHHCPVSNLYETTVFIAWTIVVVYLEAARSLRPNEPHCNMARLAGGCIAIRARQ